MAEGAQPRALADDEAGTSTPAQTFAPAPGCTDGFATASAQGPGANDDALTNTLAFCIDVDTWRGEALVHPAAFPEWARSGDGGAVEDVLRIC